VSDDIQHQDKTIAGSRLDGNGYVFIKSAHLRTVALWDLLSLVAAAPTAAAEDGAYFRMMIVDSGLLKSCSLVPLSVKWWEHWLKRKCC